MEDTFNSELSYESFWGYKADLKPPANLEIRHLPGRERLPWKVEVDVTGIQEFLKEEGVDHGRSVSIRLAYPKHKKLEAISLLRTSPESCETSAPLPGMGRTQKVKPNKGIIELDMTHIMIEASIWPITRSEEELAENLARVTAKYLAHEIQHLRQPGMEAEYNNKEFHKSSVTPRKIAAILSRREFEARKYARENANRLAKFVKVEKNQ